jgi:hypothetical protein
VVRARGQWEQWEASTKLSSLRQRPSSRKFLRPYPGLLMVARYAGHHAWPNCLGGAALTTTR